METGDGAARIHHVMRCVVVGVDAGNGDDASIAFGVLDHIGLGVSLYRSLPL